MAYMEVLLREDIENLGERTSEKRLSRASSAFD